MRLVFELIDSPTDCLSLERAVEDQDHSEVLDELSHLTDLIRGVVIETNSM